MACYMENFAFVVRAIVLIVHSLHSLFSFVIIKEESRLLNFQVTDSFLNFKHLQYIYICSCTKLFAYHCLASVVLKTCIAQFDLIVNCALTSCANCAKNIGKRACQKNPRKKQNKCDLLKIVV